MPDNIRLEYLRVKILELLVTLKTVDPTVLGVERPYFYKTQVEKVKAIMSFMTNEPERHFTMEELSEKFDISTSALKQCFKGVYGTAIYTYMRNYRMDLAASLLTQTDEPDIKNALFNFVVSVEPAEEPIEIEEPEDGILWMTDLLREWASQGLISQ